MEDYFIKQGIKKYLFDYKKPTRKQFLALDFLPCNIDDLNVCSYYDNRFYFFR